MTQHDTDSPDGDFAALQRELRDIHRRMNDWVAAASDMLETRASRLAGVVERLEMLAQEARLVSPTDAADAMAAPRAADAADPGLTSAATVDVSATGDVEELWQRMRPLAIKRLRLIQAARDALQTDSLDEGTRIAAVDAARELVGSLGGYGRLEGSAAADRAASVLCAPRIAQDALDIALADLAIAIGGAPSFGSVRR